jgi:hypothetical protein
MVDVNSPLRAELWLLDGGNRLRVISATRGVVVDQPRPGWGVERLCTDALQQLAWVASQGG